MSLIVLGVGDLGATASRGHMLKTFALGSCVAVVLLDPKLRAVGMVHVALPDSQTNAERAKEHPGYFADTGIPALLEAMAKLGCDANGKGMIVKLAGGARVLDLSPKFDIGKKNVLAVKRHLWSLRLGPTGEDVGGSLSRTVEVAVDDGLVQIYSKTRESWQI